MAFSSRCWSSASVGALRLLDLISFIGLTGFCILYLNRRLNERAIGAIRLEESSAVIKLLLRDFEENASDWLWETNASLELQQVSQRLAQVAQRPATSIRGVFPQALLGDAAQRDQRRDVNTDRSGADDRGTFALPRYRRAGDRRRGGALLVAHRQTDPG